METTQQGLEIKVLRERMREKGMPVVRLAREADLYENDMYRIFSGGKIGAVRRARIEEAARRLGLSEDDAE